MGHAYTKEVFVFYLKFKFNILYFVFINVPKDLDMKTAAAIMDHEENLAT